MRKLDFLRDIWKLTRPYFFSEEKWAAYRLLAAIIILELIYVGLMVIDSYWNNAFYNTMQHMDYKGFIKLLLLFGILLTGIIVVFVFKSYLKQLFQINWRTWLTHYYLKSYLADKIFYRLQAFNQSIDNPDQRIADDINVYIQQTLELVLGFFSAVVSLTLFFILLWTLSGSLKIPMGVHTLVIPGYIALASILYAVVGTWITVKIGRPLISLDYKQEYCEANFRYALARMREKVEAVAFYRGERREYEHFKMLYQNVMTNFRAIMTRQMKLNWFCNGYSNATGIFPLLISAPRFFSGALQLGDLMQIRSAFFNVQSALSFIVSSFGAIAHWRAAANRLLDFKKSVEVLHQEKDKSAIIFSGSLDNNIYVKNLTIELPTGKTIIRNFDLTLHANKSLLITGPSGCGKSTFLRVLAGVWQHGTGVVMMPKDAKIVFLPQKPYMPLGTFFHMLTYPQDRENFSVDAIYYCLEQCDLMHLCGFLDEVQDWSRVLSLGEQQKIGFARVLLQKPDWVFLDEGTCSLDEATEFKFYQLLQRELLGITIISVGHRESLKKLHWNELSLSLPLKGREPSIKATYCTVANSPT